MFDYLKQIRNFEIEMRKDPWKLTLSAQVFWMRINALADRCGSLRILLLRKDAEKYIGFSYTTFQKAKKELIAEGFLEIIPGNRNCRSMYQIKKLY